MVMYFEAIENSNTFHSRCIFLYLSVLLSYLVSLLYLKMIDISQKIKALNLRRHTVNYTAITTEFQSQCPCW